MVRLWRCRSLDERAFVLRPGVGVVLRRVILAGTMVAAIAVLQAQYFSAVDLLNEPVPEGFVNPELRQLEREMMETAEETLSVEQYRELVADLESKKEIRTRNLEMSRYRRHLLLYWGRNILAAGLLCLGAFPLLSTVWNRVQVHKDVRGNIVVRSWYWLPRTVSWPSDRFDRIVVSARERMRYEKNRGIVRRGWIWTVQLRMRGQVAMPMVMDIGFGDVEMGPQFVVGRVGSRPLTGAPLPEPVRLLAESLSSVTGLVVDKPVIIEGRARGDRTGVLSSNFSVSSDPELISRQRYGSLEEMPQEVRERVARMVEEGTTSEVIREERFVLRDDNGDEQTYDSWENLPEEWKKRINRP